MSRIDVFDVAEYILKKCGRMTTMKLQKLVYYCQAWSLVWEEEPLFPEKIYAWANGPVVYELFKHHQGQYSISTLGRGNPAKIRGPQETTVKAVLKAYGDKTSQWLSDLAHMEEPWRSSRRGLPDNLRGFNEITPGSMMEYYSGLIKED